ncbi:MAG: ribosome-associated translation inhibitor RaiA [Prevotella sp.]|nr:ribosome-associated translation inhibitor RaiA [Prevotella sp.]MCD8289532.1 ribosome-associated translation inhibitor RaiA [Prevotella sp.]MCD8306413.1 ribosome-associated translation inhibitor RaiA [Prevotella sp.]
MDIRIQTLRFDATRQLEDYITKKLSRLERKLEGVEAVDVQLKLVKPQTANNKVAIISLPFMGSTIRAEKTADTFEDAVNACMDVVKGQIEKVKDKVRQA